MSKLATILRQRHVDVVLSDAELIRDWPVDHERIAAARRLIRRMLYERAIGNGCLERSETEHALAITDEELHRVYAFLDFAIEPVAPPPNDPWSLMGHPPLPPPTSYVEANP